MRRILFCVVLLSVLGAYWGMAKVVRLRSTATGMEKDVNVEPTPSQAASPVSKTSLGRKSERLFLAGFFGFGGDEYGSLDELRANLRRSPKTTDALLADLDGGDGKARLLAIMALGGKGAEARAAVPRLERMLRDPSEAVRLEAAITLGRIGPDARRSLSLLEKLLRDDDAAVRAAAAEAITSVCWQQGLLCHSHDIPASVIENGKAVCLNIAPREDAPDHPKEGWCAEVAIQEASLYFGAYYPQKIINAAGRPKHPDLYSDEIPTALKNLHVQHEEWPSDQPNQKLDRFVAWVRQQIASGCPVFVGTKLFPTEHDEWSLDHFSLVVGVDGRGMFINTAWGYRESRTESDLTSQEEGLSFWNKYREYYGIGLKGLTQRVGLPAVRLFVCSETTDAMNVAVKCEGLEIGQPYLLSKSADTAGRPETPWVTFVARQAAAAVYDRIEKNRPCAYWCRKQAR